MTGVRKCEVWFFAFFFILHIIRIQCHLYGKSGRGGPAPEFSQHTVIRPQMLHGREKRQTSTTKEDGAHLHNITIGYSANGKDYVLDLYMNRELIPQSYFVKYQLNGKNIVKKPTAKEMELCEYQGKVRGLHNSWVAISTCHGLSGVISDGEELYYVERIPTGTEGKTRVTDPHFLYKHSDIIANQTCGTPHQILNSEQFKALHRHTRSTDKIRGPYSANKQTRYIELVFVVDNKEYKKLGEDLSLVHHHCKNVANIVNALYLPLNIAIALIGVVVWTEQDEIVLSSNGDTTLSNFLRYRRNKLLKDHPNDNAQLLISQLFEGGVAGKALKGSICTYEYSGGISINYSGAVGLLASTVAHMLGHNFGMEHDTAECECPDDRCIMSPSSSSSIAPTRWSSCSLQFLAAAYEHDLDYCLRNKPQSLFDGPVCGNGLVEVGEQCDGDNPCCNASMCMLYSNATCATGECCNLQTCQLKTAGNACRSADKECDLPEFCTGESEYCPDDAYKMDGESCKNDTAFCYQGSCQTHRDQCRLLWGPTGENSDSMCYKWNTKGSRHGNCGYSRWNQSYTKCDEEDVNCGRLHCTHSNDRLLFGMEALAILSYIFINSQGRNLTCRSVTIDLGLDVVDPGLVPNGAKCADGKMCFNQKCVTVAAMREQTGHIPCPEDCNGNGICDSRGQCHCAEGFAPPSCNTTLGEEGTPIPAPKGPTVLANVANLGAILIVAMIAAIV